MAKKATASKVKGSAVVLAPNPQAAAILAASETLPTTVENAAPPAVINMSSRIKVKRTLTYQLLRFPATAMLCVKIVSDIWLGQVIKGDKDEGGTKKNPPHLARVINFDLETGETDGIVKELIIPTVLQSELEKQYPNPVRTRDARDHLDREFPDNEAPGYYGKTLVIRSYPKREGKSYRTFDIAEVEIE